MIKCGFTGSRQGMTEAQRKEFISIAAGGRFSEFHYGDCVGADIEALNILLELGTGGVLHSHPANDVDEKWRYHSAEQLPYLGIIEHPAKPALERNKEIVNVSDVIIGTPNSSDPFTRSGTWATLRYARHRANEFFHVYAILPDGRVLDGND